MVHYYHASPARLRYGEVVCDGGVWLTTSPVPHATMARRIRESTQTWYVYAVEPLGEVQAGDCDDLWAHGAIVRHNLGNARNILGERRGSIVDVRHVPHCRGRRPPAWLGTKPAWPTPAFVAYCARRAAGTRPLRGRRAA